MILFQFTGLTAGDVIEISQTKQQVSAPIQPPNTPPFSLLYNVLHSLSVISVMNEAYSRAEGKPFTQA